MLTFVENVASFSRGIYLIVTEAVWIRLEEHSQSLHLKSEGLAARHEGFEKNIYCVLIQKGLAVSLAFFCPSTLSKETVMYCRNSRPEASNVRHIFAVWDEEPSVPPVCPMLIYSLSNSLSATFSFEWNKF